MTKILIRDFRSDDASDAAQVFFDAVHNGTGTHYTRDQKTAWAGTRPEPHRWRKRLEGTFCKVAVVEDRVVGFLTLDGSGLIDVAFVAPCVAGSGVAYQLYQTIEAEARRRDIPSLYTEASLSARPFFARQGWEVDAEQTVEREGVSLKNFRMSKSLETL